MKISELNPSNYLKATDLKGSAIELVMSGFTVEEIGGDKKGVVHFKQTKKGFVLNKTNSSRIATMHGDETDNWVGKSIVLQPEHVDFKGETVLAIRVKLVQPELEVKSADEVTFDDDIPF